MENLRGVFESDINNVLSDRNIPWDALRDSTVLITGATGLIGGFLARILSVANAKHNLNIQIVGHGRNLGKGKLLAEMCGMKFIYGDIRKAPLVEGFTDNISHIVHCAAITKSAAMVAKPVDVITTNVDGTRNILDLARERGCRSIVYVSSMEVYGQTELRMVREDDLGYLDLSDPRSSYPESKRLCEALCNAYAVQYGLPVKIVRPARIFGAGMPNDGDDTRMASQFVRKALAGEDIELHTQGNSIANCCYTVDAVRGLLTVLLKGNNGEVYNITNPSTGITIREMAELVAKDVCGGKIKAIVNIPKDIEERGYAPDIGFTLDVGKLNALGWEPEYGLEEMFRRMLDDWRCR